MKIIYPIIAVLCFYVKALPQLPIRSCQDAENLIIQPTACVRGDSLKSGSNFSANKWAPIHNGKLLRSCRGALVLPTGTAGYLAVHLVYDPSWQWYKIYLNNDGIPMGAEFDAVGDSTKGTTVKLDTNLFIYPYLYKQP